MPEINFLDIQKIAKLIKEKETDKKLSIVDFPDSRLYRQAKKVSSVDEKVQLAALSMFALHYRTGNCAALAATQLSFKDPFFMTVIDFSEEKNQPLCLINGEIIAKEGTHTSIEGCMSVYPEAVHGKVSRAEKITVKALDFFGEPMEFTVDGFMAKCIQHEFDHLHGRLYLHHLSSLRRSRCEKDIKLAQKQRQAEQKE